MSDLTEFLLARIAEDEAAAREANGYQLSAGYSLMVSGRLMIHPARVLAECEAKRRIVEWHESWPVLVEQPAEFAPLRIDDPSTLTYQASQRIAWLTTQEYRKRFGDDAPSAPILRILAAVYADHEDFRPEWRP